MNPRLNLESLMGNQGFIDMLKFDELSKLLPKVIKFTFRTL